MTFLDMVNEVGRQFGNDSAPTGSVLAACKAYVNLGYRDFLLANAEHFLYASATLTAWSTKTGTMTVTGGTTITDSTNKPFRPGMVGHDIVPATNYATITIATTVPGTAIANEKQTISFSTTGGTFTLTYSGQTTTAIAFNATAADVDAALEALSNIGAGDVSVTGTAGAYTVEFTGALALTNVPELTATSLLTGEPYTITGYTSTSVVTVATPATADTGKAFTITADGDVRLPDDFEGFNGDISFAPESGYGGLRPNTPDGIRELRATNVSTGRPAYYALEAAAFSSAVGQQFTLMLWPTSDSDYVLHFPYRRAPAKMTADGEYPVGGMAHSAAILQCAFAAAELDQTKQAGTHAALRDRMMSKSILHDSQNRPMMLGRAEDPAVRQGRLRRDPNNWKGGLTAI